MMGEDQRASAPGRTRICPKGTAGTSPRRARCLRRLPGAGSAPRLSTGIHRQTAFIHRAKRTVFPAAVKRLRLLHSIHSPYYYCYPYIKYCKSAARAPRGTRKEDNMKVAFNASDFNHGMSMVSHALPARVIKPYQEGVFLETMDTGLRLTVTDGEVAIQSVIPAEVAEDGSALLPARLLGELVRNLDGNVELETKANESAVVKNHGSKTRLVLFAADEFPEIAPVEPESITEITQQQFKSAVRSIIFAIATDETRRILTGCLMETSADEVRFTCLDGYRLAMQRVYCKHEMPAGKEVLSYILPGTLVGNISRMLPDSDQPITLSLSRTHMMAEFGKTRVTSPLILGEYINYRQILPTSWTTAIRVDRGVIMSAIQRASLIAREGSNNLLKLKIEDQALTISALADKGDATEQIAIDFDGNPLNIAFNANYLYDVIKNIDTPDLAMRFNTNVSPCVVCPVSGNQYTYLVLPVRVSE